MPRTKHTFGDGRDHDLTAKTEEKAQFIEWYALPKSERDPSTYRGIADALGVHINTIDKWRKDPRVLKAVRSLVNDDRIVSQLPNIIQSLVDQATDPSSPRSVQAARTLFEQLDRVEDTSVVDVSELSDEDVVKLAVEIIDRKGVTEAQAAAN